MPTFTNRPLFTAQPPKTLKMVWPSVSASLFVAETLVCSAVNCPSPVMYQAPEPHVRATRPRSGAMREELGCNDRDVHGEQAAHRGPRPGHFRFGEGGRQDGSGAGTPHHRRSVNHPATPYNSAKWPVGYLAPSSQKLPANPILRVQPSESHFFQIVIGACEGPIANRFWIRPQHTCEAGCTLHLFKRRFEGFRFSMPLHIYKKHIRPTCCTGRS